jgi:hypothetical protein
VALELAGLLVVNGAYLAVGAAALGCARSLTWSRLGVALPLGLVIVTIPASYLALLGIPVGLTATCFGVLIVAAGAWRVRPHGLPPRPLLPRPRAGGVVGLAIGAVLAVLLAYASRTFAVRPLLEWDSWAVWTAKARLLYVDPSVAPRALRSGSYGQTPYPIGLPTIEALGFGAMGRYDPTLIGVQFWLLAASFPIALWSLLRGHARSWLIGLAGVATVGAPQVLYQLLTHYADVPLGLFVGLGLASGGAWLAGRGEPWLLACCASFFGMAGITKSEGFLFALVGAFALGVAAASSRERRRITGACWCIGALLAVILPWRIYCAVYGLSTPDYDLTHVVDLGYLRAHRDRVSPVVHELWRQLDAWNKWGLLTWVILLAVVAALAAGRWAVVTFAGLWLALSSIGLVLLYWASTLPLESHITDTSYRTIVSLLIGGAALVPLLVLPVSEPSSAERASASEQLATKSASIGR